MRLGVGEEVGRRTAQTSVIKRLSLYGAAQESNLPSRGLHDRTGFEGLLPEVHLRTEGGFGRALVRLSAVRCAEIGTNSGTKFYTPFLGVRVVSGSRPGR